MERDIIFVEKAEIDRPGSTLAEIKALRAEGRMSYGPKGEVEINRYATKACGYQEKMDNESVQGINGKES